jgi:metal-dependent amidase/aminoacylase/carboxypeptidase family protein
MIRENKKINRALTGAALSLGANVEIIDSAGYSPLYNDEGMVSLAAEAAAIALPDIEFKIIDKMNTGSTDMGDLSGLMPTIHPYAGGSAGIDHGENYAIADPESACVKSAKWQLAMLILLLQNDGERAKKIITDFKPTFASKDEYFAYVEAIKTCGDRIVYNDDGTATVL